MAKRKTTGLKDLLGGETRSPTPAPPLAPEKVTQITDAVHGRKQVGRPPKGERTTKFTTNIDSALLKQVKRHCVEAETTVRNFLEELIRERLGL